MELLLFIDPLPPFLLKCFDSDLCAAVMTFVALQPMKYCGIYFPWSVIISVFNKWSIAQHLEKCHYYKRPAYENSNGVDKLQSRVLLWTFIAN